MATDHSVFSVKADLSVREKYSLVVGIDFGTSRSAFSFAKLDAPECEVRILEKYESSNNKGNTIIYAKTPTELSYDANNNSYWGWDAALELVNKRALHIIKNFKLWLKEDSDYVTENDRTYNVTDEIATYLRHLKDYAFSHLKFAKTGIPSSRIYWIITVPAIWSDKEIGKMREAAQKAGIVGNNENSRLDFVSEPEAAVVFYNYKMKNILRPFERFLVIDGGGGTVDLASYEWFENKPRELAKTSGDKCGSTFLDRRFTDLLLDRFPANVGAKFQKDAKCQYDVWQKWEVLKSQIHHDSNSATFEYPVSFLMLLKGILSGEDKIKGHNPNEPYYLTLDKSDISQIFEKPIKDTLTEIDNHLEEIKQSSSKRPIIDGVLLVGGFCKSNYLQKEIKKGLKEKWGIDEENVKVPDFPEQAIVIGATAYGLNKFVIHSRRAKLTYGISVRAPYDEVRDKGREKVNDSEGVWCDNIFSVLVREGDPVEVGKTITANYQPASSESKEVSIEVYSSSIKNPRYTDDTSYSQLLDEPISLPLNGTGKERIIQVSFHLGEHEFYVSALQVGTSNREDSRDLNFRSEVGA